MSRAANQVNPEPNSTSPQPALFEVDPKTIVQETGDKEAFWADLGHSVKPW